MPYVYNPCGRHFVPEEPAATSDRVPGRRVGASLLVNGSVVIPGAAPTPASEPHAQGGKNVCETCTKQATPQLRNC